MTTTIRLVASKTSTIFFEAVMGTISLFWGLLFLGVPDLFENYIPAYQGLERIAPQLVWGVALTAFGLGAALGLRNHNLTYRRWAMAVIFLAFGLVSIGFMMADRDGLSSFENVANTGAVTYGILTLACFVVWVRLIIAETKVLERETLLTNETVSPEKKAVIAMRLKQLHHYSDQ